MKAWLSRKFPVGSRSLIFGVHQFAWHPFTVWLAWIWLYRELPSWRETVCIVVHDWGYWGKHSMDGPDGKTHPELGARIAGRLLGPGYKLLCLYHSRSYAKMHATEPSKLCWADKTSILLDPSDWYLTRARLTGELKEYRSMADRAGFISEAAPDKAWLRKLRDHELEHSFAAAEKIS
jgi:hypothetical protein